MKTWSIIWCGFALFGVIGMCTGARWMWGIVFIAAIMACGAISEHIEEKQKENGRQR